MHVLNVHQNETEKPEKEKSFPYQKSLFIKYSSQMQILQLALVTNEHHSLTPLEDTLSS